MWFIPFRPLLHRFGSHIAVMGVNISPICSQDASKKELFFGERSLVLRCVSPRLTRCYSRLLLPQIAFSQVSRFTHPPNMRFEDKNSWKRSSASRLVEQIIFDTLVSSEKKDRSSLWLAAKLELFSQGRTKNRLLDVLSALWSAHLTIDVAVCPPAENCHQLLRLTHPKRRLKKPKKNCSKGSFQGSSVCHRC